MKSPLVPIDGSHDAMRALGHALDELRETVMGTRGLGRVANLVLGSVAHKVVQLAEVPVTLVR
jgi:nucleotide-binding universal stress UspA family protein